MFSNHTSGRFTEHRTLAGGAPSFGEDHIGTVSAKQGRVALGRVCKGLHPGIPFIITPMNIARTPSPSLDFPHTATFLTPEERAWVVHAGAAPTDRSHVRPLAEIWGLRV